MKDNNKQLIKYCDQKNEELIKKNFNDIPIHVLSAVLKSKLLEECDDLEYILERFFYRDKPGHNYSGVICQIMNCCNYGLITQPLAQKFIKHIIELYPRCLYMEDSANETGFPINYAINHAQEFLDIFSNPESVKIFTETAKIKKDCILEAVNTKASELIEKVQKLSNDWSLFNQFISKRDEFVITNKTLEESIKNDETNVKTTETSVSIAILPYNF